MASGSRSGNELEKWVSKKDVYICCANASELLVCARDFNCECCRPSFRRLLYLTQVPTFMGNRAAKATLFGAVLLSSFTIWAVHFQQDQEREVSLAAVAYSECLQLHGISEYVQRGSSWRSKTAGENATARSRPHWVEAETRTLRAFTKDRARLGRNDLRMI